MTVLAAHAQEAMLEEAAFEIRLEFLLHILRQRPASGFARGDELGKVPLDERVEQRRLGPGPFKLPPGEIARKTGEWTINR